MQGCDQFLASKLFAEMEPFETLFRAMRYKKSISCSACCRLPREGIYGLLCSATEQIVLKDDIIRVRR